MYIKIVLSCYESIIYLNYFCLNYQTLLNMTTETKPFEEKRTAILVQMQDILNKAKTDSNRSLSKDEDVQWNKLDDEQESITKDIRRIEKMNELSLSDRERFLQSGKENGTSADEEEDKSKKYLKAWCSYIMKGMNGIPHETREFLTRAGQNVGTTTEGGFLVPEGFSFEYDKALLAFGGILGNVRELSTTTGNDIPWPNTDDTANKSVILTESGAVASGKDIVFGSTTLKAFLYSTDWVKVSIQLMQDSGIPIERLIADLLAERDARGLNLDMTTGAGVTAPQGVVTASTSGKTTASETEAVTTP